MKLIYYVYILMVIILGVNFVQSAQPVQVSSIVSGMQIDYPKYDFIKLNNEHRFHAHVINSTSLKTNRSTNCILHVYNQSGYDINKGSSDMEFEDYNGVDFAKTVEGGNFSTIGFYSYVIQCNSSTEVAFASAQIEVVASSHPTPDNLTLVFFFISFIILIGASIFIVLYTIGHFVKLDVDLNDLAINFSLYFTILLLYYFESNYWGNLMIDSFMTWFLTIGGTLLIFVPSIAFIMTLTQGAFSLKNKMGEPPRRKFMRI